MNRNTIFKEAVVLSIATIMMLSSIVAVANTNTPEIQKTAGSFDCGIVLINTRNSPPVASMSDQTFYAIEYIGNNATSFDPADPGTTTVVGFNNMSAYAGTWFDGEWYIQNNDDLNFYTVDTTDATTTLVCTADQAFNGIASDGITMYGATSSHLYTVDLGTGACTQIGNFQIAGGLMIDIAIDMDTGTCYGHEIATDSIYTIDLSNGKATAIGGQTGFSANYAQGMEFDQDNDILYLTLFEDIVYYARLCTVDLTTGAATSIGDIGAGYYQEYGGFAIPYTSVEPKIPDLECDGELAWTEVEPNSTVDGTFEVSNVGDAGSLLGWQISDVPDFGTNWTFDPNGGAGLTPEDGAVTVTVSVQAPDEKEKEFEGELVIVNSADPADTCTIPVKLVTPVSQSQPTLLMQIISWLFAQFPLLALIFG